MCPLTLDGTGAHSWCYEVGGLQVSGLPLGPGQGSTHAVAVPFVGLLAPILEKCGALCGERLWTGLAGSCGQTRGARWRGVPGRWADQARFEFGPARPWAVFVKACWWILRGAEVLALRRGQCAVKVGEQRLAEVRLGQTKADIEGRGKRRSFLCTCVGTVGSDVIRPPCTLESLLWDCRGRASGYDCDTLLVVGPPRRAGEPFWARKGLARNVRRIGATH